MFRLLWIKELKKGNKSKKKREKNENKFMSLLMLFILFVISGNLAGTGRGMLGHFISNIHKGWFL